MHTYSLTNFSQTKILEILKDCPAKVILTQSVIQKNLEKVIFKK